MQTIHTINTSHQLMSSSILKSVCCFLLLSFSIIGYGQTLSNDGIVFPRMNTAERNALSPTQGQCIFNTQTKALECYDGAVWTSGNGGGGSILSLIIDGDGDTSIELENSPDEDIIRFNANGVEVMKHDGQSLHFPNNGQSVFLGDDAGSADDLTNNRNTFVGSLSGQANTSGTQNVAVGHQALKDNITGSSNIAIGQQALQKNKNSNNIAIGFSAARDNNSGNKNIAIGGFSGFSNQNGNQNTFVGYEAGRNTAVNTSGSVMIGHQAGMNETNNNRLYIANNDTIAPLIYGEFDNEKIVANGNFEATGKVTVGNDFNTPTPGTIRFNPSNNDFEGWTGSHWLSLTRLKQDGNGVTDIDGNKYSTVKIGTQEWMVENLNVSTYNNGQAIPNITSDADWSNLNSGAWCYYDNDPSFQTPYGKLYNGHAVQTGMLCPTSWHVPSDAEYSTLRNALGDIFTVGAKMKEEGNSNWSLASGTNESGFTALPGGQRNDTGGFLTQGAGAYFWKSDLISSTTARNAILFSSSSELFGANDNLKVAHSVRCVKD